MQDSVPPRASYEERPGWWVGEEQWPSPRIREREFRLSRASLAEGEQGEVDPEPLTLRSPLSVGMFAGKWASYAAVPDLPYDQREEDGGALVWESQPLEEPTEVFGLPRLDVALSADRPVAQIAVRLSDVAPTGEATRITYGVLNLTHRDSSSDPQLLVPGERYDVQVSLNGVAHSFPVGHRLRLSVSTSYWPLVWPAPQAAQLTIHPADSVLRVPVRPPRAEDEELTPFHDPVTAPELETTTLEPSDHDWRVTRDLATDVSTLEIVNDQGSFRIEETGTVVRRATNEWYSFRWDDVNSVRGETRTVRRIERGDWRTEVVTSTVLTCTEEDFVIRAELDAYELDDVRGHRRVHAQSWDRTIPRDLV